MLHTTLLISTLLGNTWLAAPINELYSYILGLCTNCSRKWKWPAINLETNMVNYVSPCLHTFSLQNCFNSLRSCNFFKSSCGCFWLLVLQASWGIASHDPLSSAGWFLQIPSCASSSQGDTVLGACWSSTLQSILADWSNKRCQLETSCTGPFWQLQASNHPFCFLTKEICGMINKINTTIKNRINTNNVLCWWNDNSRTRTGTIQSTVQTSKHVVIADEERKGKNAGRCHGARFERKNQQTLGSQYKNIR